MASGPNTLVNMTFQNDELDFDSEIRGERTFVARTMPTEVKNVNDAPDAGARNQFHNFMRANPLENTPGIAITVTRTGDANRATTARPPFREAFPCASTSKLRPAWFLPLVFII